MTCDITSCEEIHLYRKVGKYHYYISYSIQTNQLIWYSCDRTYLKRGDGVINQEAKLWSGGWRKNTLGLLIVTTSIKRTGRNDWNDRNSLCERRQVRRHCWHKASLIGSMNGLYYDKEIEIDDEAWTWIHKRAQQRFSTTYKQLEMEYTDTS